MIDNVQGEIVKDGHGYWSVFIYADDSISFTSVYANNSLDLSFTRNNSVYLISLYQYGE